MTGGYAASSSEQNRNTRYNYYGYYRRTIEDTLEENAEALLLGGVTARGVRQEGTQRPLVNKTEIQGIIIMVIIGER